MSSLARPFAAALAACLLPAALGAQQARVVEQHTIGDPEGRLMGYYAATVAFSPLGAPEREPAWRATAGVELSYVPPLDERQRSLGGAKTESTNLAPAFPRPRLRLTLPAGLLVEGSWVPPVRAFDAKANLVGIALAHRGWSVRSVTLAPRVAYSTGRVEGAITCNERLRENGGGDSIYFHRICYDNESRDRFEPTALSGELLASRPWRDGALVPYAGVGVRRERTRFDVGVICNGTFCPDGQRDPVNPILEMRSTRVTGVVGATWHGRGRAGAGAELFWLPNSVVTMRVMGSWRLRAGAADYEEARCER